MRSLTKRNNFLSHYFSLLTRKAIILMNVLRRDSKSNCRVYVHNNGASRQVVGSFLHFHIYSCSFFSRTNVNSVFFSALISSWLNEIYMYYFFFLNGWISSKSNILSGSPHVFSIKKKISWLSVVVWDEMKNE